MGDAGDLSDLFDLVSDWRVVGAGSSTHWALRNLSDMAVQYHESILYGTSRGP
jgi:hypothetical protein